ncbi:MAG: RNA-binding S4 domain-containing protein [Chloroflexota bacterium]|nr:RNA-binding S4 domain-containing protein [Lentimicrobium sp.]
MEEVRIDKWLWSVRFYKTRNLAIDACKAGKVKIDGNSLKPSRIVKEGDIIALSQGPLNKTIRVKQLLHNRVSAKLVPDYVEDLTPAEEYERVEFMKEYNAEWRARGEGRPTKKDRREIDRLKDDSI